MTTESAGTDHDLFKDIARGVYHLVFMPSEKFVKSPIHKLMSMDSNLIVCDKGYLVVDW